jgi:hypothetical protein
MKTPLKVPQSPAIVGICLFLLLVGAPPLFGETLTLADGVELSLSGTYEKTGDRSWRLSKGAQIEVTGSPGIAKETLVAHGDGVSIVCDDLGLEEARGLFAIEIEMTDGALFRVPGKLTAQRIARKGDPEDALAFTTRSEGVVDAPRWVAWAEGFFRVKGTTSVEGVYPEAEGHPQFLVSVGGENDEVILSSDLRATAFFESYNANFWREAYGSLDEKRNALRKAVVDPTRIGASGYNSFIRESLSGLNKLQQGYELLQTRRYTSEVLDRMTKSGTEIPRLDLASIRVVYGDAAYSFEPFMNWQGQGKTIVNVAYLTNFNKEPKEYPPYSLTFEDPSGVMSGDVRLSVQEGDAVVEDRRDAQSEWSLRTPIQFDLLAEALYTPGPDSAALTLEVDATGFLLRKAIRVIGQLSLAEIEIKRDSLRIHYKPDAPSRQVSSQFADFIPIRQLLFFPDKDRVLSAYRPDEISEETWDFFGAAIDKAVEAVHNARIDKFDEFVVLLGKSGGGQWTISARASGGGRAVEVMHTGQLTNDPLAEIWEGIEKNREAVEWLDLDLGIIRF